MTWVGQQFDHGDFGSPRGGVRALRPGGTREWIVRNDAGCGVVMHRSTVADDLV